MKQGVGTGLLATQTKAAALDSTDRPNEHEPHGHIDEPSIQNDAHLQWFSVTPQLSIRTESRAFGAFKMPLLKRTLSDRCSRPRTGALDPKRSPKDLHS